jgi:hypothetical protein
VLARAADPRAEAMLASAHAALASKAAGIENTALRSDFLNIPEHREIVAAWARSRSGGGLT